MQAFSFRSFSYGLSGVAGLYLLIFAYCAAMAPSTTRLLEERLASQTVLLEYIVPLPKSAAIEQNHGAPVGDEQTDTNIEAQHYLDEADKHDPDALQQNDHVTLNDVAEEVPHEEVPSGSHENSDTEDEDVLKHAATSLEAAPFHGLYENSASGILPVISDDGDTAFKAYRKPFVLNHDRPALAVAILDYGLSASLSDKILSELPSTVSLILNPYASNSEDWQKKARADGHEIWLYMPMENNDFPSVDPGAKALMSRLSLKANQERLEWVLSRTSGYTGIAASSDRAALKSESMYASIGREMFKRGLGYFELNPARYSFFEPLAGELNQPTVHNYMLLETLDAQTPAIRSIEDQIKSMGGAVITITPSLQNIEALKSWFDDLQEQGVQIVPVSAIAALSLEGL